MMRGRGGNEWLPYVCHDNLGTAKQAAGIAAELIGLQNGPCDLACIYDTRTAACRCEGSLFPQVFFYYNKAHGEDLD